MSDDARIREFLETHHPFDLIEDDARARLAGKVSLLSHDEGSEVYVIEGSVDGVHLVLSGHIRVTDEMGRTVSELGPGGALGERGVLGDGRAETTATATGPSETLLIPSADFKTLVEEHAPIRAFFAPEAPAPTDTGVLPDEKIDLAQARLAELMTPEPMSVTADTTATEAARIMDENHVSCLLVAENDKLKGIVTTRDLTARLVARERPGSTPVSEIMTPDPTSLTPDALALDALGLMTRTRIGHLPVTEAGRIAGVITHTDIVRQQSLSATRLLREIGKEETVEGLAAQVRIVPRLLAHLVGAGARPDTVCRTITAVTDAVTVRLVEMAEAELGSAPVPWCWAACGSQGRREQSGVSDQDNCLILSDDFKPGDDEYFKAFAKIVSDGLDACGYVYCPGDMMATNDQWRQPIAKWRDYFFGWIEDPDTMAQMLASVMFDLRPIAGDFSLFEGLHAETLKRASKSGMFVGHMVANALKHTPPLGLLRGLSVIRSGEHRNRIDMKLNGVVPVVDIGRIFALREQVTAVNTRERLVAAKEAGQLSRSGGRDLIDAYDLIAGLRLDHQAALVRRGERPDNFLDPKSLSDLEQGHLRDAFQAVRTIQSSLGRKYYALQ